MHCQDALYIILHFVRWSPDALNSVASIFVTLNILVAITFDILVTFLICERGAKVGKESLIILEASRITEFSINTPVLTDSGHSSLCLGIAIISSPAWLLAKN